MTRNIRYPIAFIASLLIVAPAAFAQSSQTQVQHHQGVGTLNATQPNSGMIEQHDRDGVSVTKQKTEGDITDVGPGSKAYYGNALHSKY